MFRGFTVRRYTRVPRGLKDVKLRQQIICNPRFEQDIKLVRLWLYSNSYYFLNFYSTCEATIPAEQTLCQAEEIFIIQAQCCLPAKRRGGFLN